MKYIYPAVFEKVDENNYKAYFPDLAECYAAGDTLTEAIENAREEARNWILVELEDPEGCMPLATEEKDIVLKENEEVRQILVHIRNVEGWAEYQPIQPV